MNSIIVNEIISFFEQKYSRQVTAQNIVIQPTRKEFEGDYTIIIFPLAKLAGASPDNIATVVGEHLISKGLISNFNVVKGFLNFSFEKSYFVELLNKINSTERFGFVDADDNSPLMMVEYSSPNTNKPLHLGHIRNNLLGDSISRIQKASGWRVVKTNIINDRGIHICKSMLAWKLFGNGETPQSSGQKGDHLVGKYYVRFNDEYKKQVASLVAEGMATDEAEKKADLLVEAQNMLRLWEEGDSETIELWKKMNGWVYDGFDITYRNLGISFDKLYYESQTYIDGKQEVIRGLEEGEFVKKSDGSVWADLSADGLDEKLLLRADGTSVYMTQDIGTAKQRYEDYKIDKMVYVVGNEQNYHFQVLSILLDRLGFEWGKELVHFSYGMVELPDGKMKSREGTVVDADDLVEEMIASAYNATKELGKLDEMSEQEAKETTKMIGLGALRYFILKVAPVKNMIFNPQESIDLNGNSAPFIQYTNARINSILRKAKESGVELVECHRDTEIGDKEKSVIQHLSRFPDVLAEASKSFSPALIANYCYDLAKEFNQFYHDCPILREESAYKRNFRLVLCKTIADMLGNAMGLLGIELPEKM
ncbi:MAG: arginine--tRNA ligase [Bacteroidales bacterium]|nr:MAG: arginine--tRNA ligase [Bacteroidales bacterium]